MFPEAEIFTLFCDDKKMKKFFPKSTINTSFLQKFYNLRKEKESRIFKISVQIEECEPIFWLEEQPFYKKIYLVIAFYANGH